MTTLIVEIPERSEKTIADLIEQLGGKIIKSDSAKSDNTGKLSRKEKEFLKSLDDAVEFINLHQEGKVKAKTIDEFLNEL